jgi:2-polyprenyl-6-methoxyphenol hydroxylase-like FAD-dependent oxidoreductase
MPPQGESTGLAIEDSILFGRVLEKFHDKPISAIFKAYENTRRSRIDVAYNDATTRWEGTKDKSWLTQKFYDWLTWIFLWYKAKDFEKSFYYDVRSEEIVE